MLCHSCLRNKKNIKNNMCYKCSGILDKTLETENFKEYNENYFITSQDNIYFSKYW